MGTEGLLRRDQHRVVEAPGLRMPGDKKRLHGKPAALGEGVSITRVRVVEQRRQPRITGAGVQRPG